MTTHGLPTRIRRAAGMTLIEMILGLAGVAMVGLAVAAMTSAVAYGTSSSKDIRSLVVKHKTIASRLTAALRGSHRVLASNNAILVLWVEDVNGDAVPQLSELRRLEYEGAAGELRSYKTDFTGMTEAQIAAVEATFALDANFINETASRIGQTYFPVEVWSHGVAGWTASFNDATVQDATLVAYRITLQSGDLTDIAIGTAAMRNK
ncbi:MAG: type II secretion system protein [Phycisphaeraceae bacterium]|nr:type II secretion system protein [Phycisphaeraceae bacterium]